MTSTDTKPADHDTALTSVNPATGEVIGTHVIADDDAVAAAVEKARAAAATWGALSFDERRGYLLRWSSRLVQNSEKFCELIHAENGKPLDDAFLELMLALEHIAWAAKHAKKILSPRRSTPAL